MAGPVRRGPARTERRRGGVDPVEDYRRYVDGRSRDDGVRAVLSARYLALPQGAPDDPPRRRTLHGLAAQSRSCSPPGWPAAGCGPSRPRSHCCAGSAVAGYAPGWSRPAATAPACCRRRGCWTCSTCASTATTCHADRDAAGRTTRVTAQRLVSQDGRHLAVLRATFEAENWSGPLRVRSTVDGPGGQRRGGRAVRHRRTPRLPARQRSGAPHRRLLPGPHQPRLDTGPSGLRLGDRPRRPHPLLDAVHPGPRQRPRRHPGRHHPRRHPPRRHGRHRGHAAVLLYRLETRDGLLWLHPTLPPELGHAEFATKAGSTRPAQLAPRSPGTPLPATGSPAAARNRLNSTSRRIRTAWRRGPTTISTPTSVAGSAVAAGCGRRAASWPAARTPPSPPRFGSVCLPEHGGGPVASCPPR